MLSGTNTVCIILMNIRSIRANIFYLHNSIKYLLFLIYRPPIFYIDDINIFLNEFSDIIRSTKSNEYILIGDINFHHDTDVHPHSLFINLIDSFSLIQHITFPTHYISHILDLVVTPISNMLSKPPICLPPLTDHNVISLAIDIPSKFTVKTRTVYRDIKSIDFELFSDNIKTNFVNIIPNINSLNMCLKLNLDIFAPTKIHYFKVRSNKPWFNSSTSEAKRSTRKFKRIYLKILLSLITNN